MATDPQDKARLDVAAKAAQARVATSQGKQLWQENFDRNPALLAAKSLAAAKVIGGLAGSWMAYTDYGYAAEDTQDVLLPPQAQTKVNKTGQPGLPEINFVPYNWRTNRFGPKGPSLLGHPISFRVVGPTLKSPYCDWQWYVIDNSGGGLPSPDGLRLIDDESVLGNPAPYATTLAEAYNLTDLDGFPNGLYVIIAQTGEAGVLPDPGNPDEAGGLSDGLYEPDGGAHAPLVAKTPWSKYEIFRVTDMDAITQTLWLDPHKRLASHFTFPAVNAPTVRAITLVTPHLTRLQAVPGSGPQGREQAFLTLSPDGSAGSDLLPPYTIWTTGSGFEPTEPACPYSGAPGVFGNRVPLPVPLPVAEDTGVLLDPTDPFLPAAPARRIGTLFLRVDHPLTVFQQPVAPILRIFQVEADPGTLDAAGNPLQTERFLGWFAVSEGDYGSGTLSCIRVAEVDPATGTPFFGGWLQALTANAGEARLRFTVHLPISTLYSDDTGDSPYNADLVEAARLTTLIDPSWVERSTKAQLPPFTAPSYPVTPPSPGARAERADRAIFDTTPNSDPGNLLDLGFRMVLFPAWNDRGVLRPDMNFPITTRDVILDPTVHEPQFIDIDYAAGVVRLSHPPRPGALCAVDPHDIASDDSVNIRGEIILFAACVPYSMEPGQLDSAVRVTGDASPDMPLACEQSNPSDVYSHRLVVPLGGTAFTCGNVTGQHLDLDFDDVDNLIPPTGFVEILTHSTLGGSGEPLFLDATQHRQSTFGYVAKSRQGSGPYWTRLEGLYGGGVDGDGYTPPDTDLGVAVIRRDTASPTYYRTLVEYQQDTTYGNAKRNATLHFVDTEVTPQMDGSVLVSPQAGPRTEALMNDLFRNWLITGGEFSYTEFGGPPLFAPHTTFTVAEAYLLVRGKRVRVPEMSYTFTGLVTDAHYYVYYDVSGDCPEFKVEDVALPLGADAILIASFVKRYVGFPNPPPWHAYLNDIIDLRNPLWKIDERFDLLVGGAQNQDTYHFDTLGKAIAYANEIMAPTSGNPSTFSLKIKVVGKTAETGLIMIKADGIVVEGSTDRSPAYIGWNGSGPLINLNGYSHLAFRNLYFSRDAVASADAHVFENTGVSTRVVIDNCWAFGNWTSLFWAQSNTDDVGLLGSRITNNHCADEDTLTLVNINGTHGQSPGLLVENNVGAGGITVAAGATVRGNTCLVVVASYDCIVQDNVTDAVAGVGIQIRNDPVGGRGGPSQVRGNRVGGHLRLDGGNEHLVDGNRIDSNIEVSAGNRHTISNNWAGIGVAVEGFISVASGLSDMVIHGNHILGLDDSGVKKAIYIVSGTGHVVSDNIVLQHGSGMSAFYGGISLAGSDFSRVTGNKSGDIKVGPNCIVADNEVLEDDTPTGGLIWVLNTGCTVTGNRALGVTRDGSLAAASDSDPDVVNGTTVVCNRFSEARALHGGIFGQPTVTHAGGWGHNTPW